MQVKFEYECIAESINDAQFQHELCTYCGEVIIPEVGMMVMRHANRLKGDPCFVALLHKWYEYSKELDNVIAALKESGVSDEQLGEKLDESRVQRNYDELSWLIADML